MRRLRLEAVLLVAPAVLFAEAAAGEVRNGLLIAVCGALLVLLTLGRMSMIADGLRHTAVRERELRRACEALLSETDVPGVERVLRKAFTELGTQRVWAETMFVNTRSRQVMERIGLRFVRVFHVEFDDPIEGTEHGEVEYEIRREEWLARQGGHPRECPPRS